MSRPKLLSPLLLWLCIGLSAAHAETPSNAARTLYLIRHGAYDDRAKDNAHAHLTALGVAQARLVAERLRTLPEAPAKIVVSTMTRAEETAAEIGTVLPGVPQEHSDLLRECTPDVPSDIKLDPADLADAPACQQQLDQAFKTYFTPVLANETDFLVCHGNVIRYLIAKTLGIDPKLWIRFSLGHTSVTEIQVRANGTMRILAVGDMGHLPPNLQSSTMVAPTLEPEPVQH